MTETAKALHPFEKAGLGLYPYRLTTVTKNAFVVAAGTSDAHIVPGSSCDYCGTGIMYEFWCISSDQKRFKVGCDCILRLDTDPELKAQAKSEQLKLARESRTAKKQAEYKAKKAEWDASKATRIAARKEEFLVNNSDLIEALRANSDGNSFFSSLLENFNTYGSLTDNQIVAANKSLARIEEQKKIAQSGHIGTLNQRIKLTVTTQKVIDITYYVPGYNNTKYAPYGCKYRYILVDSEGNALTYVGNSDSMPYTGCTSEILATVTEHSEYNGTKQTTIARPKLIREVKTLADLDN